MNNFVFDVLLTDSNLHGLIFVLGVGMGAMIGRFYEACQPHNNPKP